MDSWSRLNLSPLFTSPTCDQPTDFESKFENLAKEMQYDNTSLSVDIAHLTNKIDLLVDEVKMIKDLLFGKLGGSKLVCLQKGLRIVISLD